MKKNIGKLLGVIIGIFTLMFWFGFILYVKMDMQPQMATVLQLFILTLTSIALFWNGSLWIVFVGFIFWYLCTSISISLIMTFGPGIGHNISYIIPLIYSAILSWNIAKNNKYKLKFTLVYSILIVLLLIFLARVIWIIFSKPI